MAKQLERKVIEEVKSFDLARVEIDDFIDILKAQKQDFLEAGYDKVEIEFWQEWDSAELRLICSRMESDEEYQKRVARSQKKKVDKFEQFLKKVEKLNFACMPSTEQLETAKEIYDLLPENSNLSSIEIIFNEIEFVFKSKRFAMELRVMVNNKISYRGMAYGAMENGENMIFSNHDCSSPLLALNEYLLELIAKK